MQIIPHKLPQTELWTKVMMLEDITKRINHYTAINRCYCYYYTSLELDFTDMKYCFHAIHINFMKQFEILNTFFVSALNVVGQVTFFFV